MQDQSGLTVRRYSRRSVRLDAMLRVSGACSAQVRLTGAAGAEDGWVRGTLLDASEGGMGIESGVYFPRRSILHVKILDPARGGVVLMADVRVQRSEMCGREHRYVLGTAFVDRGASLQSDLGALLERLGSEGERGA